MATNQQMDSEPSPAPEAASPPPGAAAVDEKLYSRQLYVMGHEAQRRMMASRAVLVGLSGLGAEVAKNIVLAGIAGVTLVDPCPACGYDLGGNFYLGEGDVGSARGRAEACAGRLAELNEYVKVDVASGVTSLADEGALLGLVAGASVVVVTVPLPTALLTRLDEKCRSSGVCFIYSLSTGVFGQVFCDFGEAFTVTDKDGENPATSQVENILPSNPAVVKVLEDQGRHGLETGDSVTFSRVRGLDGLLKADERYEVKVTGPHTFELVGVDASGCSEPATQGYITQVKTPVTMSFKSYASALSDPGELMMSDFAKFDRPALLHLAYKALASYAEKHGGDFPTPGDAAAAGEVYDLAKGMDSEKILEGDGADASRRIVTHLASGSRAVLSPMCATLGGIVGQEVLKACSGKFTPISGFFYFDADETLPESVPSDAAPTGTSRYDSTVAVFGKAAQEKLLGLNYFLVGAGAIGCEMLKNWALMGVACGPGGKVHVTDMDRIEKSNLSRQFLFRNSDIDEFKSATAAKAAASMNDKMNVVPYQEKVSPETENVFGDDFYDKLDGVCTALDNVEARLYVDTRCLFYHLPMLESGTLGTKGNTQVVVPNVTENYGATRDPPEKSIPVCTLKNFPNQIQHTLQWARDYFEGEFRQSGEDVNSYLSDPDYAANIAGDKLAAVLSIRKTLVDDRPVSFEDCVIWARLKFETIFNNQIRQLLHNFPEDQVTSSGTKFWSGSKRCPRPLVFDVAARCEDAEMRNHFDFIVAASNLRAHMFGIKGRTDEAYFVEVLQNVIVPDFTPADGVKIAANEAEAKEEAKKDEPGDMEESDADAVLAGLPKPGELAGFKLNPIEFDKDLDDHMLFVTACSNLRALNYSIPTEDTHRSRAIAGRIIPAIATTTALVTGLICLELYKIIGTPQKELKIDAYKNGFVNLAIPFMTLSEPTAPAKTKAVVKGKEWNWTAWDSLDVNLGDITLKEFITHFENEYGLDVSMISHGVSILFSFFANKKKLAERMTMKMSEVVESVTKKALPGNQLFLVFEIIANDLDTDEEVELPYVKFRFR